MDREQGEAGIRINFKKSGRTTCGGYTDLFLLISKYAGPEAVRIDGIVKTCYFTKGKVPGDHTWNAVKINSKWYLVDNTYDATGKYLNGQFSITGEFFCKKYRVTPANRWETVCMFKLAESPEPGLLLPLAQLR